MRATQQPNATANSATASGGQEPGQPLGVLADASPSRAPTRTPGWAATNARKAMARQLDRPARAVLVARDVGRDRRTPAAENHGHVISARHGCRAPEQLVQSHGLINERGRSSTLRWPIT